MRRPSILVLSFLVVQLLLSGIAHATDTSSATADDLTPPVIAERGPVDANASGFFGGHIVYEPPLATDDVDGSFPATCAPAPASLFPIGDTSVTCNARDSAGNAAEPTSFVVRVTLRGVGSVGAEQPSYAFSGATLEGIEGAYRLLTPDGNPLGGVDVKVRIIRQLQFVGYLDAETFVGQTDDDGAFAFQPSRAFTLPSGYLVLATPSHPLLVGGNANGRYVVTAG